MHKNRHSYCLIVVLSLSYFVGAFAQTNWKTYTPPDKRFSVEVPSKPSYQRRTTAGIVGPLPGPVDGITAIDSYDLNITEPNTTLRINVYSVSERDTYQQFEKRRAAAVEDPNYVKNEAVEVNGLHGRQYIYQKEKFTSRLLIVFADHLVYTITFNTEGDKGVNRGAVNRIFDSFKPIP